MDFHAAMETFAEAWVAANTQTVVNSADVQSSPKSLDDLPTLLPKDQLAENRKQSPNKVNPADKPGPSCTVSSGKTLPIHCIVEQTSSTTECREKNGTSSVELDSYAIIPSSTLFTEIVRTAMLKLGYSTTESVGATGAIQFKNWKPLPFDVITDNTELSVDDVLGELTSVSTLRIKVCSHQDSTFEWTDGAVRNAVIELLNEMSQSNLAKMCPLSQPTISNIANSKINSSYISNEKVKEFGVWYTDYRRKNSVSAKFQDGAPKDSRLTFHPTIEVPLLRDWYRACSNPSDDNFQRFADELNKGAIRQQRVQVTANKIKIWWKNERQRERKLRLPTVSTKTRTNQQIHKGKTKPARDNTKDVKIDKVTEPGDRGLLNMYSEERSKYYHQHDGTGAVLYNNPKLSQSHTVSSAPVYDCYTSKGENDGQFSSLGYLSHCKETIDPDTDDVILSADDIVTSQNQYL